MNAEEVMTRNPATVTPQMTVSDAVSIMETEGCGVVPVVASPTEQTIVGILTDRDIAMRACCPGAEGPETVVSSVMTTNLFCVHPDDDLSRVCEMMENAGIRRIPVVEDENKLLGIISMKDLADRMDNREVGNVDSAILEKKPNN